MVEQTDCLGRRPVHVPERTCVGCRTKAPRSVLMRIVSRTVTAQPDGTDVHTVLVAEPDPRRRLQGRGAWLHPTPDCLDLAIRRRAFARALRVPGPLDTEALAVAVAEQQGQHDKQ